MPDHTCPTKNWPKCRIPDWSVSPSPSISGVVIVSYEMKAPGIGTFVVASTVKTERVIKGSEIGSKNMS